MPVFLEGVSSNKILRAFSIRAIQELHTIEYDRLALHPTFAVAFDLVSFVVLPDILYMFLF